MNRNIEKLAHELLSICTICNGHSTSKDSYTSPAFAEFLDRALTTDDIPMQSCNMEDTNPIRQDLQSMPWEDSIKNFIFDMTSVNTRSKFSTCIVLSEYGYKYQDATIDIIGDKYGIEDVTLIDVIPVDQDSDLSIDGFYVRIRHKNVDYKSTIDTKTLVSHLVQWYIPERTLIYCHDNSVKEYSDLISMMPMSVWSVSCTLTNYIQCENSSKECKYVCATFSCAGSLETRAVGSGPIIFTDHNVPAKYQGQLNYYFRCVRGSRHSSGRCYDCQILYKVITNIYKSPLPTPKSARFPTFSTSFLSSIQPLHPLDLNTVTTTSSTRTQL